MFLSLFFHVVVVGSTSIRFQKMVAICHTLRVHDVYEGKLAVSKWLTCVCDGLKHVIAVVCQIANVLESESLTYYYSLISLAKGTGLP